MRLLAQVLPADADGWQNDWVSNDRYEHQIATGRALTPTAICAMLAASRVRSCPVGAGKLGIGSAYANPDSLVETGLELPTVRWRAVEGGEWSTPAHLRVLSPGPGRRCRTRTRGW